MTLQAGVGWLSLAQRLETGKQLASKAHYWYIIFYLLKSKQNNSLTYKSVSFRGAGTQIFFYFQTKQS